MPFYGAGELHIRAHISLYVSGAKVYMLGRSAEKLATAQAKIMEYIGINPEMIPTRICNLASLQSIREFATEFKKGKNTRVIPRIIFDEFYQDFFFFLFR